MEINIEDSCSICMYCKWIGIKQYDCYDVSLYKCNITEEVIDEFHVENKKCNKFEVSRLWENC